MGKLVLSRDQVSDFYSLGFLKSPLRPFSDTELKSLQQFTAAIADKHLGPGTSGCLISVWKKVPDFLDYAINESVLDLVESLIGPDIALVGISMFVKRAKSDKYVPWHSDIGIGFEAFEGVNPLCLTLAVTDSVKESGCLRYVPGSHKKIQRDYIKVENYSDSLFGGGSFLVVDKDLNFDEGVVDMELAAGECSFTHLSTVHGGGPNQSENDRTILVFKYIPANKLFGTPQSRELFNSIFIHRILVRGRDRAGICNKFAIEPAV